MEPNNRKALDWLNPWAFSFAAAAMAGWVLSQLLPDTVTLSGSAVSVIAAVVLLVVLGVALQVRQLWPTSHLTRPRLLLYKQSMDLFVFAPVEWLSYRATYTIFVKEEDGFELFLCVAHVFIIQDDKKIQLKAVEKSEGNDAVWASLQGGSKEYFPKILVKPGGPLLGANAL